MRLFIILHLVSIGVVFAKVQQEDELTRWFLRLKSLAKDCPRSSNPNSRNDVLETIGNCLQSRVFLALDNLLSTDVITVVDGIDLVCLKAISNSTSNSGDKSREETKKTFGLSVLNRIAKVFKTHVLKIDIDKLAKSVYLKNSDPVMQGRKRKRRNNLMPLMATGLLLMGSVLVPMGFQFLAVLGGKALLLSKMALLLSSIQGLKKIATSGMNYGFYHNGPEPWHERSHPEPNVVFNPPPPPPPPLHHPHHPPYSTFHHH